MFMCLCLHISEKGLGSSTKKNLTYIHSNHYLGSKEKKWGINPYRPVYHYPVKNTTTTTSTTTTTTTPRSYYPDRKPQYDVRREQERERERAREREREIERERARERQREREREIEREREYEYRPSHPEKPRKPHYHYTTSTSTETPQRPRRPVVHHPPHKHPHHRKPITCDTRFVYFTDFHFPPFIL